MPHFPLDVLPREYYVKASNSTFPSSLAPFLFSPLFCLLSSSLTYRRLGIYNAQVPTDTADRISLSNPTSISRLLSMASLNSMARQEPERFDALERAGFKVERYGDLYQCLYERFGGHYMDVGTSAKITNGQVCIYTQVTCLSVLLTYLDFSSRLKSSPLTSRNIPRLVSPSLTVLPWKRMSSCLQLVSRETCVKR